MFEWVRNMPTFKMQLIMFCVIIQTSDGIFRISIRLRDNLPSFEYSKKNCTDNISSEIQERQRLIAFILVNTIQYPRTLQNNIYHSNKRVPPPFFHSDTNPVFGHVLIHSFDKTHVLVVTVELIWLLLLNILSFNFVSTPKKFLLGWQDPEEAM